MNQEVAILGLLGTVGPEIIPPFLILGGNYAQVMPVAVSL